MRRREKSGFGRLLRLLWWSFAAAAVVKELRLPAEERTWNGEVAGVVPYDFRMPTPERARARLWDPEGDLVGPQVFGIGWAINFGRLFLLIRERLSAARA
jgi:hypothetical protein